MGTQAKKKQVAITPSYEAVINSPIGKLRIITSEHYLLGVDLLSSNLKLISPKNALSEVVINQLEQYFNNPRYIFKLPIKTEGTAFQERVWKKLLSIPVGKTQTYSDIAKSIQSGPRAIGNACRTNPIPLIIPCHRVVGANNLGGYSGARSGKWTEIKKWLLAHESKC